MKTHIKNSFLLPTLIAAFGLIPAAPLTAQTFTTLHSFSASSTNASGTHTNRDGANPYAGLSAAGNGNIHFETASLGGSSGNGAVFAINLDGTGFTNLHDFNPASTNSSGDYTNSDGIGPWAGLIVAGKTLYGTAYHGGRFGEGAVFAINTDGTGFTNLHSFSATDALEINQDGAYPNAELILLGNTLYGTASKGGNSGMGTIFALQIDGTGFTNLHSFTNGADGAIPVAALIAGANTLYGTATGGGAGRNGTIFAINPDGTGFTVLHAFDRSRCFSDNDCPPGYTCNPGSGQCSCAGFCLGNGGDPTATGRNFEGSNPNARLTLSNNALYGTTAASGDWGYGTVFAVNTNGTGFRVLHTFTGDFDGDHPWAGLTTNLSGTTLYGTAYSGGSSGKGTVFALNTDGTDFITLHSFTGGSDGANPIGGLVLTNNTLYGTTDLGGSSGKGAVFSLSFAPQLTIHRSGANLVLSWPTNYAGFDYSGYTLQYTTTVAFAGFWSTVFPESVVIDGQNTLTYPISGTQQFYRLRQHTGGCHINLDCPPGTTCVNGICVCFSGRGCGDGG